MPESQKCNISPIGFVFEEADPDSMATFIWIPSKNHMYADLASGEYSRIPFKNYDGYNKHLGTAHLEMDDGLHLELKPTGAVIDANGLTALEQGKSPNLIKSESVIDIVHETANEFDAARTQIRNARNNFDKN